MILVIPAIIAFWALAYADDSDGDRLWWLGLASVTTLALILALVL